MSTESYRPFPKTGPTIVRDDRPYEGLETSTMSWPDDPEACVQFTCAGDACYVVDLARGRTLSGTDVLRALRANIQGGLHIIIVGVTCDIVGFYAKMEERGLIDDFTTQDVDSYFVLDDDCYEDLPDDES